MENGKTSDPRKARRLAKVLTHDLRLQILRLSVERDAPLSPREAAEELPAALSNVAYHFHVLADVEALSPAGPADQAGGHLYSPNPSVIETPAVRELLAAAAG
jgi:predicted transcriptional regulator